MTTLGRESYHQMCQMHYCYVFFSFYNITSIVASNMLYQEAQLVLQNQDEGSK